MSVIETIQTEADAFCNRVEGLPIQALFAMVSGMLNNKSNFSTKDLVDAALAIGHEDPVRFVVIGHLADYLIRNSKSPTVARAKLSVQLSDENSIVDEMEEVCDTIEQDDTMVSYVKEPEHLPRNHTATTEAGAVVEQPEAGESIAVAVEQPKEEPIAAPKEEPVVESVAAPKEEPVIAVPKEEPVVEKVVVPKEEPVVEKVVVPKEESTVVVAVVKPAVEPTVEKTKVVSDAAEKPKKQADARRALWADEVDEKEIANDSFNSAMSRSQSAPWTVVGSNLKLKLSQSMPSLTLNRSTTTGATNNVSAFNLKTYAVSPKVVNAFAERPVKDKKQFINNNENRRGVLMDAMLLFELAAQISVMKKNKFHQQNQDPDYISKAVAAIAAKLVAHMRYETSYATDAYRIVYDDDDNFMVAPVCREMDDNHNTLVAGWLRMGDDYTFRINGISRFVHYLNKDGLFDHYEFKDGQNRLSKDANGCIDFTSKKATVVPVNQNYVIWNLVPRPYRIGECPKRHVKA
jgi:outer membrane biosynthesis protein TonB